MVAYKALFMTDQTKLPSPIVAQHTEVTGAREAWKEIHKYLAHTAFVLYIFF